MGLCYYWLESYDSARSNLEKYLHYTNDFIARKFLALAYYKTDDLENSYKQTVMALALRPDKELQILREKLIRERRVMDRYVDARTSKFKVLFSGYEHGEIKKTVLEILKEAYASIGSQINHYPENPITVILYTQRGFFDITRAPGWAGGLYDGKIRIPVKNTAGKETMLRRVLFHEYTHALVRSMTAQCPLWLNEGLAEYFSSQPSQRIDQIIPLKLLERSFPSGDPRAVLLAYIESYSAVSYLIERYGLYRMKDLLLTLGKGTKINDAFKSIFYISYDRFIQTWGKDAQ
jgi:hypothetical protein